LQCAKEAGTSAIYVIESAAARAAVAAELGADKVIDPNQSDVLNEILQLTGRGADVVLECAGAPNTLQQAIDMVKPGGRVILVGVSPEPVEIVPLILIAKQVSVQGLLGYEADDFRQAMRLLEQGKIDATRLVTDIVPLDGVQEAFQSLANPEKQIKVLVEP
jgi:(R,R)-butanediol dehydrogenase/meso-butanediol dehydrogenase/diacetyl reductase